MTAKYELCQIAQDSGQQSIGRYDL